VDDLNFDIRRHFNDYILNEARKIFALPTWELEASWYGVDCQTDDPSSIFANSIDENIHIVTGIGGKGMTSSAGFAQHHLGEIYND